MWGLQCLPAGCPEAPRPGVRRLCRKANGDLLQEDLRQHAALLTTAARAPDPTAGQCQPTPPPETPSHPGKAGSVSYEVTATFPMTWHTQGFACALQKSPFPLCMCTHS